MRFTANSTNFKNQIYGVLGRGNIIKDPHEIAYGSCTTKFNKRIYQYILRLNRVMEQEHMDILHIGRQNGEIPRRCI